MRTRPTIRRARRTSGSCCTQSRKSSTPCRYAKKSPGTTTKEPYIELNRGLLTSPCAAQTVALLLGVALDEVELR